MHVPPSSIVYIFWLQRSKFIWNQCHLMAVLSSYISKQKKQNKKKILFLNQSMKKKIEIKFFLQIINQAICSHVFKKFFFIFFFFDYNQTTTNTIDQTKKKVFFCRYKKKIDFIELPNNQMIPTNYSDHSFLIVHVIWLPK